LAAILNFEKGSRWNWRNFAQWVSTWNSEALCKNPAFY